MEASGTSGMKVAMNGLPSLIVLDDWWIEGHIEGVTGWSIGDRVEACREPQSGMDARHAAALYEKFEEEVLPCFSKNRERFIETMRRAIALNGAFFSTQAWSPRASMMRIDWGKRACRRAMDRREGYSEPARF